jgi:23S rRNA pseudouridine2604 synthase
MPDNESQKVRINKFLSEIGFCSRREADRLIEERRVKVNGKVPEMGTKINFSDHVTVDGQPVHVPDEDHVYIAFNKPRGIVSTTDVQGEPDNIIDYINHPKRIFPIGRLDKASEGLILLTSDGDIVNKILRSKNNHEKEYLVTVSQPINDDFIKKMSQGIPILGTITKKCFVEATGKNAFRIILTQGLNRQIRRMCEYLGYEVTRLKRIRIMHIQLDLKPGEWRDLSKKELEEVMFLVADSSKTHD